MPRLVGPEALVVEVEPQAGDGDDVVGLAASDTVAWSLASDANAEVTVLLQVEFGDGFGGGKPDGLSAGGVEDGEPTCFGVAVEGVLERLRPHDDLRWRILLRHGKFSSVNGWTILLPPFVAEWGQLFFQPSNAEWRLVRTCDLPSFIKTHLRLGQSPGCAAGLPRIGRAKPL